MAIIAGQDILASDFIDTSAGAGDSGKATKLNASGKLDNTFLEVGFGGSGLDGALNVTSGTTTIDAGNARVVVKNYTSINISNGATLTLSNPATDGTVLILKCQGNCTIDGAIDLVGMGASESTSGFNLLDSDDHFGANGTNNSGGSAGVGGTGGIQYSNLYLYTPPVEERLYSKSYYLAVGSGGGVEDNITGIGGNGGGVLIIECAGALDFSATGTIDVSGADGTTPATHNPGDGGGGGGSTGMALIIYGTLTANAGTITAAGGDGGDGGFDDGSASGQAGDGGGGGAGSYSAAGGDGGDGQLNGNNAAGAGAGGGGGGGEDDAKVGPGTGGTGGASDSNCYAVVQNIYL